MICNCERDYDLIQQHENATDYARETMIERLTELLGTYNPKWDMYFGFDYGDRLELHGILHADDCKAFEWPKGLNNYDLHTGDYEADWQYTYGADDVEESDMDKFAETIKSIIENVFETGRDAYNLYTDERFMQ